MGTKKRNIVGRYVSIASVFVLLATATSCMASDDTMNKSMVLPTLPVGMVRTVTQSERDPVSNGFGDPLGFFDNTQWRQSLAFITPYYEGKALKGFTRSFLLYFTMNLDHYTLSFTGSVVYIFTDGSSYVGNAGITVNWWSNTVSLPVLMYTSVNQFWKNRECSTILVDVDYVEDGVFIRHITRTFHNSDSDMVASADLTTMAGIIRADSGPLIG